MMDQLDRPLYAIPAPTESAEQEALFEWAEYHMGRWPALECLYHIPNEGKRSAARGAQMKREGMKKGVPDLCLPVAMGAYHGLYIEMKRRRDGRLTKEQKEWMEKLNRYGNKAVVCRGWEEAAQAISEYMTQKGGRNDGEGIPEQP